MFTDIYSYVHSYMHAHRAIYIASYTYNCLVKLSIFMKSATKSEKYSYMSCSVVITVSSQLASYPRDELATQ